MSALARESGTPCDQSRTVSASGQRVSLSRLRKFCSTDSGTFRTKGVMICDIGPQSPALTKAAPCSDYTRELFNGMRITSAVPSTKFAISCHWHLRGSERHGIEATQRID